MNHLRTVCTLLFITISGLLAAQSYSKLWDRIEQATKSDLPREAINIATTLENKAIADGNLTQEMTALFVKMRLRGEISPDSVRIDKERIALRIQQITHPSDSLFWETFLAKTIAESYHFNNEERRKYSQKMLEQLGNMESLHSIKSKSLTPLVKQGKDADEFDNDVLHMLLFDCLDQSFLSQQERTALSSQAETFYHSKHLYAGAIRFALRYEDAEAVVTRYADRPENAIAYASWVEKLYAQADLSDNHARQHLFSLAHEGIKKYGKHRDAKRIKAVIEKLENPTVNLTESNLLCYPNLPMKWVINANNIQKVSFDIYRCSADGKTLFNRIATLSSAFPKRETWRLQSDTLSLTLSEPGVYKLIQRETGEKEVSTLLHCSRITPFLFYPSNGACRIMALDTQTGEPLKEFSVVKHETKNHPKRQWDVTKGDLWLSMKDMGETSSYQGDFQILMPGDSCSKKFYLNLSKRNYYGDARRHQQRVQIFIDRNIYRPGQTVHVVGVLYTQKGDSLNVDSNACLEVNLMKRGNKAVASFEAKTDEYGRFNGDFLLPADQQEGDFFIQVRHANTQGKDAVIHTEGKADLVVGAYKRQTFSVEFLPIETVYTWGDTLQVRGKVLTMTLQPMSNALVRYAIGTNTSFRGTENDPIEGVLRTNAQGEFSIPLLLKEQSQRSALWRHYYSSYSVSVSVVGDNGETQTGQLFIPVHQNPTTLDVDLPEVIVKEHLSHLVFRNTNNMAVEVDESVTVCLYDDRNTLVWIQKLPANTPILPSDWTQLDDGVYRLEAETPSGGKISKKCLFIGEKSEQLPAQSPSFVMTEEITKSESEKWLLVGHSRQNITLFKDVVSHKGELLSSEIMTLSEGIHPICLSYDTIYQEGATVHLTILTEGEFYQKEIRLERPHPDLRLNLSWKTFRNRLSPGQEEEWELRITTPDGQPVSASLTARLYDASLDALAYNKWRANPYRKPYFLNSYAQIYRRNTASLYYAKKYKIKEIQPADFSSWKDEANRFERQVFYSVAPTFRLGATAKKDASNTLYEVAVNSEESAQTSGTNDGANASNIPLRQDFKEVAFMQSALHTDADGKIALRFTLPEQLTTWKFTAFVHDKHLRHALLEEEIIVQKSVTVSANVPRFVREGDQLTIPIVVRSLLTDSTKGRFVATFFDADTNTELSRTTGSFLIENGSASFRISLPALNAESLSVKGLSVPRAIGCQVAVEGKDFADGEVHQIPVVSDRIEVVRNLPFSITEGDVHTYQLDTLWTDTTALRSPRITLNFTPSALHEALRALASLSLEPTYGIDDWARRYYALSLTLFLHERGIYLPDFDLVKTTTLRDEAAAHIRQKQLKNGAWAWFDGMRESAFITNEMLLLFARLESLVGNHPLRENASQALRFMQEKMEKLHQEMEAEERTTKRELPLGELPLRYLDACAYLKADTTAACQYFLTKAENMNANYSLYGKAVMSRVLRQNGKKQVADLLLRSVQEYLVETPEMGAYFDAPKAQMTYHSYRIPTQTAVIEAFNAVGNTDLVKRMQQWLLQSRRTQQWETSRATADAVFALCLSENDTTTNLHPNGANLAPTEATFQGIYRSLTVETSDTVTETRIHKCQETIGISAPKTTISSTNLNLSYGSARASYSLPISKVESYDSGLKITLRLEVKRNGAWEEVQENEPIDATLPLRQVAQIVASRDFDFVRLSMPRPACTEPVIPLSGYSWQEGVGCYRVVTDHGADFYADKLPKGSYTIVEMLHTDRSGTYEQGVATITCTYAPEFAGNTTGRKLQVGETKK